TLTLEFADKNQDDPCPCCGGRTTRLTRFVHADSDAYAVYYAAFSDNHPERFVTALISIGKWDEGSAPKDRVAFRVRIRSAEREFQVMVIAAADTQWNDAEFLGHMLNRNEALKHRRLKDIFHITDHLVTEDRDVIAYLEGADPAKN